MFRNPVNAQLIDTTQPPLDVRCGQPSLGHGVRRNLDYSRLAGPLTIIVDAPSCFALSELPQVKRKQTLVVSDNPCPEYWLDL